jgi:hypothetical protein
MLNVCSNDDDRTQISMVGKNTQWTRSWGTWLGNFDPV